MAKQRGNNARYKELNDPVFFLKCFRLIMREWSIKADLTGNEITIILFILDRTIGWGKEWEYIAKSQFCKGIEKNDVRYAGQVGMSQRTVDTTLRRLIDEKKLIREKPGQDGGANEYSINFEWRA